MKLALRFIAISFLSLYALGSFAMPSPLPGGDYVDSCTACTIAGNGDLNCFCKDVRGRLYKSRLAEGAACDFVQNKRGVLSCLRWQPQPLPYPEPYYPRHHHRRHYESVIKTYEAGPIWNQMDAERKCPSVCSSHRRAWTGAWETTIWAIMSVCACEKHYGY